MKKEVKFGILDALGVMPHDVKAYIDRAEGKKPKISFDPSDDKFVQNLNLTIEEWTEYLERLCSQTPLTLLHKNEDGWYVATRTIYPGLEVTGIVLNDRVLYLKALTYDEGCRLTRKNVQETVNALDGWVRENFPEAPYAHLASPDDVELMMDEKLAPQLQLTLEILEHNKYKIPNVKNPGCFKRETAQVWVGAKPYPVHMYMQYCGDLLAFSMLNT
jgi:hypothetical protein